MAHISTESALMKQSASSRYRLLRTHGWQQKHI